MINGMIPTSFRNNTPNFGRHRKEEVAMDFAQKTSAASHGTGKVIDTPVVKKLERKPTEDINESAEAFISKFRQQLMIQRLNSIENYEKMLAKQKGSN